MKNISKEIYQNLCRQLNSFWETPLNECERLINGSFLENAVKKTVNCIGDTKTKYALSQGISYLNTTQYSISLY